MFLFTRLATTICLSSALLVPCRGFNYNDSGRLYGGIKYHPDYDNYHDVIAVTEPDIPEHVSYTRVRPNKGVDITLLIILAAFKFLLLKAGGFGLILLFLIKIPLFLLFIIVGKFFIAFKAAKFVKILTLPISLLGMVPLLGIPLLLLGPLLLPLLLALPIPVLTQATTTTAATTGGRRRKREITAQINGIEEVLRSEQCLERIACQLGSNRSPSIYTRAIAWALEKLQRYIEHPKLISYTEAYKSATKQRVSDVCLKSYTCKNPLESN